MTTSLAKADPDVVISHLQAMFQAVNLGISVPRTPFNFGDYQNLASVGGVRIGIRLPRIFNEIFGWDYKEQRGGERFPIGLATLGSRTSDGNIYRHIDNRPELNADITMSEFIGVVGLILKGDRQDLPSINLQKESLVGFITGKHERTAVVQAFLDNEGICQMSFD